MNRENAKQLLHDVHTVLSELKLTHFLIDGTLLGAIREGDFIGHDNDMDLGVLAEEWSNKTVGEMTDAMLGKGITVAHMFGDPMLYFEVALRRDGVKCDLFFYRRDGAFRIFHAFKNGAKNLPEDVITYEYDAELIENITPLNFQGEMYPAPADPVAVLVAKYGEEWRTPIKVWDWQYGPHNVRKQ